MPIYERGSARIRYEVAGSGFPLFVIYGGGLNSKVTYANGPFDAVAEFKNEYKVITMDLRNANGGESVGPLEVEDPWKMHTDDQIGLLNHLGVDKFLVIGFCIGNPLIWNLIQRAPRPGRHVGACATERRRSPSCPVTSSRAIRVAGDRNCWRTVRISIRQPSTSSCRSVRQRRFRADCHARFRTQPSATAARAA